MSAALPMALRVRFQEYVGEGLSGRAAAARLKLSAATGVRWLRKMREQGSVAPATQGRPRGHGKLAPHRAFLEELIVQDGDITLPELAGALETATAVIAHPASIGRFLRKPGYTYKKVTGGDRTPPRPGEVSSTGLVQAPYSGNASASRTTCFH